MNQPEENNIINLDYASHTPVDSTVLDAFVKTETNFYGNVMSTHKLGKDAHEQMRRATEGIASLLGVDTNEIIYTSGASEANNLAIKGIIKAYEHVGKHILSTPLEHPSVSGTLASLTSKGYEIELLKILQNGRIDLEYLEGAIRTDTVLICVSVVDSELGVIQPIDEIAQIVAKYRNCHLHIDAAQAMGKVSFSIPDGVSTLCFTPHKFYGLCGVGVLIKRENVVLEPLIHGGKSTTIYRSGTPILSLAVSTYTALDIALKEQDARLEYVKGLRDEVVRFLKGFPLVHINSPAENASPYILNLSVEGVRGSEFQAALDTHGVCVSVKSACSTDLSPSRPVMAITGSKKHATSSWRISFSHLTTREEIAEFYDAFEKCYNRFVK